MQLMDRKSLSQAQISLLLKLKNTLLKKITIAKGIGKEHSRMLLDVLSEIDQRKGINKKVKYLN